MRFHVIMQLDPWIVLIHQVLGLLAILVAISLFCVWREDDRFKSTVEEGATEQVWICQSCGHKNRQVTQICEECGASS